MGDALRQLAGVSNLSPKDAVLARALVRQGLAPGDRVVEAARAAAADPSGEGILARLTGSGDLTDERAREIRAALERRLAERSAAAGGRSGAGEEIEDAEAIEDAEPTEDAEPIGAAEPVEDAEPAGDAEPTEGPAGTGRGDVTAGPGGAAPGEVAAGSGRARRGLRMWKPKRREASDGEGGGKLTGIRAIEARTRKEKSDREAVDSFVQRFVRSRLHQLMIHDLARMGAVVADPRALARRHGAKEKQVRRILEDWRKLGLLKTVSTFPFYFDPPPADREAAKLFVKAWRNPVRHGELLKKILEQEGT